MVSEEAPKALPSLEMSPAEREATEATGELKDKILKLVESKLKPGEKITELLVDNSGSDSHGDSAVSWKCEIDLNIGDKGRNQIDLSNECEPEKIYDKTRTGKTLEIVCDEEGVIVARYREIFSINSDAMDKEHRDSYRDVAYPAPLPDPAFYGQGRGIIVELSSGNDITVAEITPRGERRFNDSRPITYSRGNPELITSIAKYISSGLRSVRIVMESEREENIEE